MLKKIAVGGIIAALAVVLVIVLMPGKNASAPQDEKTSGTPQVQEKGVETAGNPTDLSTPSEDLPKTPDVNANGGTFSEEGDVTAPDIQVEEIVYDGKNFQPSSLTVKVGDIVIFRNKSTKAFWPASNPHPAHTDYPEFDAKKAVAAGQTFEFKFTKEGTWKFHDHLNPTATGVVVVQK